MKTTAPSFAWLAAALALFASGIAYNFWSYQQILSASSQRHHASDVIFLANDLMSDLKDAEMGRRGYLLSRNENDLAPYLAVRDGIDRKFETLSQLSAAAPGINHLRALAPLIATHLDEFANRSLAAPLPSDPQLGDEMSKKLDKAPDKRLMNQIRTEMNGFIATQTLTRIDSDARFDNSMRRLLATLMGSACLAILIALFFAYLMYQRSQQQLREKVELETQRLEQSLRDSAALVQTILNTGVDGIVTIRAHAGVIDTANPAIETMFGYTAAELVGQHIGLLIPELDQEQHNVSLAYYGASDEARAIGAGRELIGRRQDGTTFPLEIAVSEMMLGGERFFTGILRNISTRKAVEMERARLDQVLRDKNAELEAAKSVADKANLAKSEFLSSMSHELRSPLNAILGFAQLMESSTPEPTAGQKASIEQILKAGWYLLELINEVLDLALIESGRLSLSVEPTALSDVLEDCHTMIEPMAQKREISLHFPDPNAACYVGADRTRLKQVLINLLSNAIKYNRVGGSVTITCKHRAQNRLRISMLDTGEGLSPTDVAQLFQPFNRLGKESSDEQGTGIGLVVSKRLVEQMGGDMGVSSTLGAGSVFWIELDLAGTPQLHHEPDKPDEPDTPDESVPQAFGIDANAVHPQMHTLLCVEDNRANMELVRQLIARRPNIRLLCAEDALRSIALAKAYLPDVILMDINLSGISGLQALKLLRDDPLTRHIPVLALSANAMVSDIERGLAAGFYGYLTKPIRVNEFMMALDEGLALAASRLAGS